MVSLPPVGILNFVLFKSLSLKSPLRKWSIKYLLFIIIIIIYPGYNKFETVCHEFHPTTKKYISLYIGMKFI